jgi:DNA polymerase I-like protein with 3'-5' exonuclease and polymerase domains
MPTNQEKFYKLFRIACTDLLVLQEMEWNGMLFDAKNAEERAVLLNKEIAVLEARFKDLVGNAVSITSGDHISAILYGGIIEEVIKIPAGYYKSGTRKGEVKYANHVIQHTFERLVNPLKDTLTANSKKKEDAKQIWSVGEDVLKQLKGSAKAKEIISIILEHRRIYKAVSTYLVGYGDLIKEMGWKNNVLHPNFNQCIVKTSRLSSSKPNGQNMGEEIKQFIISRYEE